MKLLIDQQVAQAVVNFLKRQPFEEVHQLMAAMLSLKPLEHVEAQAEQTREPPAAEPTAKDGTAPRR